MHPAFSWQPQPAADQLVHQYYEACCAPCPATRQLKDALYEQTGTRLIDWLDHLAIPYDDRVAAELESVGFACRRPGESETYWEHSAGLFPQIIVHESLVWRMAARVDSVHDFLAAQGQSDLTVEGGPQAALRKAKIAGSKSVFGPHELWVVERHGCSGWDAPDISPPEAEAVKHYAFEFQRRERDFAEDEAGFEQVRGLIDSACEALGIDRACDLFFAAERAYWMKRNRAAQVQKARQDALGLGWGNHDHHTYRSSRRHFTTLVSLLERFGFQCRERFYAGREAGWGAQILEQPACSLVVFADVDLQPHEVTGDFAHEPLAPATDWGTVGLWCRLHGEAFLQPGMHHLECRFDFAAACRQLLQAGVRTMKPFTDLPYLRQAFTEGEVWPVSNARVQAALSAGLITAAQAEGFSRSGALGSHLEILQRDQGYKGFYQAGINDIIQQTDPRKELRVEG